MLFADATSRWPKPIRSRSAVRRLRGTHEQQVDSAFDSVLGQQVRDVELGCARGDMQPARDLLIGEVFEQKLEHLFLPAAQALARQSERFFSGSERLLDDTPEPRPADPEAARRAS